MRKMPEIENSRDGVGKVIKVNEDCDWQRKVRVAVNNRLKGLWFNDGSPIGDVIDVSPIKAFMPLGLREIVLGSPRMKDVSVLEHFPDLEVLYVGCPFTKGPDFSIFKNLRVLKIDWRTKAKSILQLEALEFLQIARYPFDSLEDISHMKTVKRFHIHGGKLTSLSGIEKMTSLETLDIFNCRNLESLEGIEKLPNLKKVIITRCKKITRDTPHSNMVTFNSFY